MSLLTPHEPDLGLGRPGAGISLPDLAKSAAVIGLSRHGNNCADGQACAGGLGVNLGMLPIDAGRLAEVKAELDASIKARAEAQKI